MIVANDITQPDAGFEVDTNEVTFVTEGAETKMPLMSKRDVAEVLVKLLEL
jgi:phosphopantothenoylcysteine decarboxylase/phosphopantothenate--cysteine ligase